MNNKLIKIIILLIIPVLGFLIYGKVLFGGFVFDDHKTIVGNAVITGPIDIGKLWNLNKPRFLTSFSYALNYNLSGPNPISFHLVNIVIHIINSFLVFFIVRYLLNFLGNNKSGILNNPFIPLLSAVIFLVHPIQTSAVSYISQRYAVLSALFYFSAFLFYLKAISETGKSLIVSFLNPRFIMFYFISLVCASYSFLTKENSYTLPVIILVTNIFIIQWVNVERLKKIVFSAPFFILAVLIFYISYAMPSGVNIGKTVTSLSMKQDVVIGRTEYFLTELNVIRTYTKLLIFPVKQNIDYDFPISKLPLDLNTLFSGSLIVILLFLAFYFYRKAKIISFSIIFFFISLSVESSFIPIIDVIFEHRLYLPMFGFSFMSAYLMVYFWDLMRKKKLHRLKGIYKMLILIYIFILASLTFFRNNVWISELTLWSDAVKKSHDKARVHYNLAIALHDNNRIPEAVKEFEHTLKLDPKDRGAYQNLGAIYEAKGDKEKALSYYIKAVENNPYEISVHNALGSFYAKNGNNEAAERQYKAIIALDSQNAKAYDSLGVIYANVGKFDEAVSNHYKALRINPELDTAYFNLGNVYFAQKKYGESLANFEEAIIQNPGNYLAYYYAGIVSVINKKNDPRSREYFQKTLQIKPDFQAAKDEIAKLK
jgi:protein O-mannosyl-transferase